jgi:hypothetical protein
MSTSKRLRAPLIVMFGVIIAVVAFAIPATAAPWPYTHHATTSVSNQSPRAGSSLTFCGQDFLPGETVTITLDHSISYPSVTTDTSGAFCTTIVLGVSLTAGTHTLTATGATSGRTSGTAIQVLGVSASAAPTTSGLAFTGANAIGIGALGGLLLLGGAAMVLAGRRRKVNA